MSCLLLLLLLMMMMMRLVVACVEAVNVRRMNVAVVTHTKRCDKQQKTRDHCM